MFSIRVHQPNVQGHKMHECQGYEVKPNGSTTTILMSLKDGTTKPITIDRGGMAFVMGDSGKTVEVVRPDSSPRTAQMRGGR